MSHRQTTLFVSGFSRRTRARDLAYEFERYGPLVRCDIPAPRNDSAKPYAFVEFEDDRDCREAHYAMRDTRFEGHRLEVQFAKNAPSASWRYEREGGRGRSRSPPRRGRSPPRRHRSPSPAPRRGRSISPLGGRRDRSPSASRRRSSASRSPVRGRSEEKEAGSGKDREADVDMSPVRNGSRSPVRRSSDARGDRRSRSPSQRGSASPRARSVTP